MATLSEDSDSWAAGSIIRRDFRHGYHEEDDYEAPYKSKQKKARTPRAKGCPARKGENRKAHIYVWVENHGKDWAYRRTEQGLMQVLEETVWYTLECVGCAHVTNRRYRWGKIPNNIYSVRDAGMYRWRMN